MEVVGTSLDSVGEQPLTTEETEIKMHFKLYIEKGLTSTVPPVSCLWRNTDSLASLGTVDGSAILTFLDWM